MEGVLGVDAIVNQILLVNSEETVSETPLETAMEDLQAGQQFFLVNNEGMVLETVLETPLETAVQDIQPVQDLGGLHDQLNTFILGQQSVETVRKTKREAKAFQTWLDGQREAEWIPMAKIEPKYEPSSLAGTFSSIKRFLEQSSYPVPLMGTEDFKMAREVLASKKKDLKTKGKGNRPNKVSIFFFFFLIEREKKLIKLCFEN